MKVEEERERFGKESSNDESKTMWEPNPNKVRGMVMKYARTRDVIQGESDSPDVDEYIDDLWQWLQDKLGEGFEAVFQGDEMSPSGRFDRIGKDNLKGFTAELYKSNEDYRETVYEKWETVENDTGEGASGEDDGFPAEGVTGDLAALAEMGHNDSILEFFVSDESKGPGLRNQKEEPAVGMYKHYMVEYAIQVNGIPADAREPSAEAFIDEWTNWLAEYIFKTDKCIMKEDSSKYKHLFVTPVKSDVVSWAKELWQSNDRFRENVKDKWGDSYSEQDTELTGDEGLPDMNRPSMGKEKQKRGQVKIGDYT